MLDTTYLKICSVKPVNPRFQYLEGGMPEWNDVNKSVSKLKFRKEGAFLCFSINVRYLFEQISELKRMNTGKILTRQDEWQIRRDLKI